MHNSNSNNIVKAQDVIINEMEDFFNEMEDKSSSQI